MKVMNPMNMRNFKKKFKRPFGKRGKGQSSQDSKDDDSYINVKPSSTIQFDDASGSVSEISDDSMMETIEIYEKLRKISKYHEKNDSDKSEESSAIDDSTVSTADLSLNSLMSKIVKMYDDGHSGNSYACSLDSDMSTELRWFLHWYEVQRDKRRKGRWTFDGIEPPALCFDDEMEKEVVAMISALKQSVKKLKRISPDNRDSRMPDVKPKLSECEIVDVPRPKKSFIANQDANSIVSFQSILKSPSRTRPKDRAMCGLPEDTVAAHSAARFPQKESTKSENVFDDFMKTAQDAAKTAFEQSIISANDADMCMEVAKAVAQAVLEQSIKSANNMEQAMKHAQAVAQGILEQSIKSAKCGVDKKSLKSAQTAAQTAAQTGAQTAAQVAAQVAEEIVLDQSIKSANDVDKSIKSAQTVKQASLEQSLTSANDIDTSILSTQAVARGVRGQSIKLPNYGVDNKSLKSAQSAPQVVLEQSPKSANDVATSRKSTQTVAQASLEQSLTSANDIDLSMISTQAVARGIRGQSIKPANCGVDDKSLRSAQAVARAAAQIVLEQSTKSSNNDVDKSMKSAQAAAQIAAQIVLQRALKSANGLDKSMKSAQAAAHVALEESMKSAQATFDKSIKPAFDESMKSAQAAAQTAAQAALDKAIKPAIEHSIKAAQTALETSKVSVVGCFESITDYIGFEARKEGYEPLCALCRKPVSWDELPEELVYGQDYFHPQCERFQKKVARDLKRVKTHNTALVDF